MLRWKEAILVMASVVFLLSLLIVFVRRFGDLKRRPTDSEEAIKEKAKELCFRKTRNYYVFRRGAISAKTFFSWADHPSLVADAVENGWSRFAFVGNSEFRSPSALAARSFLGACAAGDHRGGDMEVEISWEVCQGSADFMQKIILNLGLKKTISNNAVIKTGLPLPGPPLGNSSFPQEAYFEITILSAVDVSGTNDSSKKGKTESEKAKLIQEYSDERSINSESLFQVTNNLSHGQNRIEEMKHGYEETNQGQLVTVSLGLSSVGGSVPMKLPGSYTGSIGFSSNGSVYLDGVKLLPESEKNEWGKTGKVIGCGYNPSQRKVFFTVDSYLVQVIHCKSEDFSMPMYPTLAAANANAVVLLVNLGQSAFRYAPANAQRNPNPCFLGPMGKHTGLGYEDSKELFSMGRIDSQWLNRGTTAAAAAAKGTPQTNSNSRGLDFDQESEGDELFEIVLDSCGRSPKTVLPL